MGITLTQRVVQLQNFFDQVGPQRLAGLGPIPGTARAEISHHCHGASQRRFVLHVTLAPNMIPAALTTTFSPETTRAWVDVDLAALVANARKVALISGSRLLPMVKANGYGLGAVEIARALEAVDPWGYGVAAIEEGESLRAAGISRPILVATPLLPYSIQRYLELDLRPAIGDPAALDAWISRTERPFHLEIDTGMSRAGVRWT